MNWESQQEGQHVLVRALFLRVLGLVYAIAFLSLWVQIEGLIGSQGILPVADWLEGLRQQAGSVPWWALPTLCWLDASDLALHLLCGIGALCGLLLMAGVAPALMLVLAWVFYLSLALAGQAFLSFQWDSLLLETGFLALLWAPLAYRLSWGGRARPSRAVLWLLRLLLFRLMFSSGLVKLLSGDLAWRELAALSHHYQTQPLVSWTSWYAHQLPDGMHMVAVALMFFIELVVPFCIFLPRIWRAWGALPLLLLQVLIGLTGNYGFFNLLSAALCISLLDDGLVRRLGGFCSAVMARLWPRAQVGGITRGWSTWPGRLWPRAQVVSTDRMGREWPRWFVWPLSVFVLLCGARQLTSTAQLDWPWPPFIAEMQTWTRPFYLVNHYGLFAVMTTERLEIVIEGSADGEEWKPYAFRYKAGAVEQMPAFVQPHMPRLDWQMWFAALRSWRDYPWFSQLMLRLLEGSPPVLDLLQHNPFPDGPPVYVRARLYDYRFTAWGEAGWWSRREKGLYAPALSLRR